VIKTITELTIHLEGESPIFGDSRVSLKIEDEAAGPFVKITCGEGYFDPKTPGTIWLEEDTIEPVFKAMKFLLKQKGVKEDNEQTLRTEAKQ
jgi:hypothetical protein